MNFDKRTLNTEAKKYNFAANTYEKVIRLTEILDFIHHTPILKENLALPLYSLLNKLQAIHNLTKLIIAISFFFI